MKIDIQVTEAGKSGEITTVLDKRQYGTAFDRSIIGAKQIAMNAVKARVFVELIKQKKEIEAGIKTDTKFLQQKDAHEIWLKLVPTIQFNIING